MAKRTKSEDYRVIRTFDSPQGLKKPGEVVSMQNKADAARLMAMGFIELAEPAKIVKKTSEKVKAKKHPAK